MPRTTDLLTISIQKSLLNRIRREAKRRDTSVSALLRTAFLSYTQDTAELYTDEVLEGILKRDVISKDLQKDLDRIISA